MKCHNTTKKYNLKSMQNRNRLSSVVKFIEMREIYNTFLDRALKIVTISMWKHYLTCIKIILISWSTKFIRQTHVLANVLDWNCAAVIPITLTLWVWLIFFFYFIYSINLSTCLSTHSNICFQIFPSKVKRQRKVFINKTITHLHITILCN